MRIPQFRTVIGLISAPAIIAGGLLAALPGAIRAATPPLTGTCMPRHPRATRAGLRRLARRFSPSLLRPAVSMTRYRLAAAASLSALTLLVMAGCSSAASTSAPAKASPSSPAKASPASATGQTYASKAFVVPLTVTVDASLRSPPNPDSRNLLSWDAAHDPSGKVRFLVPVSLYRPGSSAPQAPPRDYLAYLQGLTIYGVKYSDVTKITVDGHPATLMSVTSTNDSGLLDGSTGCPKVGADRSEGCFGFQPGRGIRIAVIPVGNSTLLAWARTSKDSPDTAAFFAMFETMLKSVRFR